MAFSVAMPDNFPLSFQNQYGPIDSRGSFSPFGPLPLVGDWFIFGREDLGRWTNTTLVIRLVWSGLPENFIRYYQGYMLDPAIDNSSFRVDLYLLGEGADRLWNDRPLVLFAEDEKGVLVSERTFKLKIDPTGSSGNGFRIKMVLLGPADGFGSGNYAEAVVASALANAQGKRALLPNLPFVPQLSAVEVFWED